MVKLKNMLVIVLVLSVILVVGCSSTEETQNLPDENSPAENNPPAVNNPPPTTTLAVVNGENILPQDVTAVQNSLASQGQEISEEDALEQAINLKILQQEVEQEGIVVTNEEAEATIEQQLALQGATLDEYKQQLELQGLSYEAELENLKSQLATQTYIDLQLEGQTFDVTEEEAQEFYDMYVEQSPEEVPPFAELQPQIIASLEQQKQQEALTAIVQELRVTADVQYE